jgi:hypothetical protein
VVEGSQVAVMKSSSSVGQLTMTADQTWQASSVGQHTLFVVVHDSVGKSTQSGGLVVNVLGAGTSTPTPTATQTPTATPTETETSGPTATRTPTALSTEAETPRPTATRTPRPTATPTETKTPRPTAAPQLAQANLSGQWTGVAHPNSRQLVVQITQSGSSLTGSLDLAAAGKGSGEALSGSRFDSNVNERTVHLQARLTPSGGGNEVTLSFDGELNSGERVMSGNWQDSLGESGTVTLNRGQRTSDASQPGASRALGGSQQFDLVSALVSMPQLLVNLFSR